MNTGLMLKIAAGAAAAWAAFRYKGARDAGVPLDVAFKYPTTNLIELRMRLVAQQAELRRLAAEAGGQ